MSFKSISFLLVSGYKASKNGHRMFVQTTVVCELDSIVGFKSYVTVACLLPLCFSVAFVITLVALFLDFIHYGIQCASITPLVVDM